ncbi:unnamed protein product [Acanthoscelides obtectus]|uniref:Uncharacterized protein n=1 Tax=Acanthoscelides obtectus TaxID=200917 RepID=A0A9P0K835_ACAOB|nr:unnamed protein product [Acanthoscelides obtectus]CAK1620233.1 hypothetical protein AOBTE_LOCUS253 [Acanthoscelides obtectus]
MRLKFSYAVQLLCTKRGRRSAVEVELEADRREQAEEQGRNKTAGVQGAGTGRSIGLKLVVSTFWSSSLAELAIDAASSSKLAGFAALSQSSSPVGDAIEAKFDIGRV